MENNRYETLDVMIVYFNFKFNLCTLINSSAQQEVACMSKQH